MIRLRKGRVNKLVKMYVTHSRVESELRDQIRGTGQMVDSDLEQHHELEVYILHYEARSTDKEIKAAVRLFNKTSH